MMEIVLASKSPRRHALLEMLGLRDFRVVPASCREEMPDLPPDGAVMQIAMAKALDVARRVPDRALVIGADTLVYLDGIVLGKPADEEEAAGMLRSLSGRRHAVYTGVALTWGGRRMEAYEKTDVVFRALSEDEINAYVKTGEPMDKAGAYGAQGLGAVLIQRIEGDFFNVVGLPLRLLYDMLRRQGVDLLEETKPRAGGGMKPFQQTGTDKREEVR